MTLQLQLDPMTEEALVTQARVRGWATDDYAGELLRLALGGNQTARRRATQQEFQAMLDELAKLGPPEMPPDEQTWPRSVIYADHA